VALLYDPGKYMPDSEEAFDSMSWMLTWPDGPWHLHDVEPGGSVYLVRAGSVQEIVWETRVTHTFGVPYEALGDLANEVFVRWGLVIETPKMSPGGYCIGWRAAPVQKLDRGPQHRSDRLTTGDGENLDLTGFQETADMSAAFRDRWSLLAEPDLICAGRPVLGWSGPAE
jgi:hypothetical protein